MTTPSEDRYRQRFSWKRVAWGTHCANCLSSCTYRVFAGDSSVRWEEQSGTYPATEPGVPDRNPMGCQKGAAWSRQLTGDDRLLHPMRRVGERGSGQWERITWDDALTEIADAVLDAIEESGPDAVVIDESAEGGMLSIAGHMGLASALGAVSLDSISTVNDVPLGHYLTFGHIAGGSSSDDTFHAELVLVWHCNPAYSRIPYFHYLTEARYAGAEVALIAPDYSPSAPHCDTFVPVVPGTDAALALAMCRVIVDEGLVDEAFVSTQTDLSLLVRTDTRRLLRQSDLVEGGSEYGFFHWDPASGVVEASQDTLRLAYQPALRGRYTVEVGDGTRVELVPAFELMVKRLAPYDPEAASAACGVHPDTIRTLARKVASKRTKIVEGFDTPKHYHGDLMERSMNLLLALTGNWGGQGRGHDTYAVMPFDGSLAQQMSTGGIEGAEAVFSMARALFGEPDPDTGVPPPLARPDFWDFMSSVAATSTTAPPFFYWLDHCGYGDIWSRQDWGDSPRPMADYIAEARTTWAPYMRPAPDVTPRVLFQPGTSTLRRTRGGRRMLLRHLWPELSLVVSIDQRMNGAGMHADILLPAAYDTERVNLQYPIAHSLDLAFSDQVNEPAGEARSDWRIFCDIADAVAERARVRGLADSMVGRATPHPLGDAGKVMHRDGRLRSDEALLDVLVRDSALAGVFDEDLSLTTLRERGFAPARGNGVFPTGRLVGSEIRSDETFSAFRWHVEGGVPYATTTGRATFYVDHPWFLEAGEELPVHKDAPAMGGHHPYVLTGGHPRWSIHACNATNPLMLETTRGHPTLVMNPRDAAAIGIADDDEVEVTNDLGTFTVHARVATGPRPGQVILYAAWEPYGFERWDDGTVIEPGMVKWLHLADGWGHLRFTPNQWQPVQFDRMIRVDVRKVSPDRAVAGSGPA